MGGNFAPNCEKQTWSHRDCTSYLPSTELQTQVERHAHPVLRATQKCDNENIGIQRRHHYGAKSTNRKKIPVV